VCQEWNFSILRFTFWTTATVLQVTKELFWLSDGIYHKQLFKILLLFITALPRIYRVPGWTVQRSNPGAGEIFGTRPNWPWGPPSFLYKGFRVPFPTVKRPERGVDHLPPSSVEVKERVEIHFYSPFWAFTAYYSVIFTFTKNF